MNPDISVIIPSYNTAGLLRECLVSLRANAGQSAMEIIVADNGSGDDSVAMVRAEFPEARVVEMPANRGYGAACNAGAAHATGQILLFLNSDTRILPGSLESLVNHFRQQPEMTAAACHELTLDGRTADGCRSHHNLRSAISFLSGYRLFRRQGARYRITDWDRESDRWVDNVSGFAWAIRRDIFRKLGGFDEQLFLYMEEQDIALRLQKAGHKIRYLADVRIQHAGGASSGWLTAWRRRRQWLSGLIYLRKKHDQTPAPWLDWVILYPLLAVWWLASAMRLQKDDRGEAAATNAFHLYWGQLAVRLFNALAAILIGRLMGPEVLGVFSFVLATVGLAHLFAVAGLNLWLVREVARDKNRAGPLLAQALSLNLLLGGLAVAGFWVWTYLLGGSGDTWRDSCLAIFVMSVMFSACSESVFAVFDGCQEMKQRAKATTLRAVSRATVCALVVIGLNDLKFVLAGYVAVEALTLAGALILFLRKFGALPWREHAPRAGTLARRLWAFAVIPMVSWIYSRVHFGWLAALGDNSEMGAFAAAFTVSQAITVLPSGLMGAIYPQMSVLAHQSTAKLNRALRSLLLWLTVAGGVVSVSMVAGAGWIVAVIYGPRFESSGGLLHVLALAIPAAFLNSLLSLYLYVRDAQQRVVWMSVATCGVTVLVAWWLISQHSAVGAAWAVVVGEFVGLGLYAGSIVRMGKNQTDKPLAVAGARP